MKKYRIRRVAAVLVAATLVAAACGGDDGGGTPAPADDAESSADDTDDAATDDADDAPAPAAGEIDRDATLRLVYTVAPTSYDPHRGTSSTDNTSQNLVFDRLVHTTSSGDPIPGLAVDWSLENDPPALNMTLREGVLFHDGTPFNAEAAKANLDRAIADDSNVAVDLAAIDEIVVVDEYEIRLELNSPGGALPLILSDRGGMMLSPASFDNPDLDRAPIGAGMYRLVSYEAGVRSVFERFEDYWEPEAAAAARVELTYQADDDTRLNAVLDGQADWANIAARQIPSAENAGLNIFSEPDLAFYHLQVNKARSEFGNPLVRQAMSHAIDREGLVEGIFQGLGEPNVQPFPRGYFAHDPALDDFYPYDPDRARELLAEAGLADGFSFELLTANLDGFVRVSEALQAQLREIGIDVELIVVPVNEVVNTAYVDKVGDAVMITFQGRPDPFLTLGRIFAENGPTSASGLSTPLFMEAFGRMQTATDEETRVEAILDAVNSVVTESLSIILLNANANYVTRADVVGFEPFVTAKPEFRGMGRTAG